MTMNVFEALARGYLTTAEMAGDARGALRGRVLYGPPPPPFFDPSTLFALGEKGGWYDPTDPSTLFQDSAGSVPITSASQPVGRIADKSGNGFHFLSTTTFRPTSGVGGLLSFDNANAQRMNTGTLPSTMSNMDCFVALRRATGDATTVLFTDSSSGKWFDYIQTSATTPTADAGTPTYAVDGVTVPTTRLALYDALTTGNWHILETRNLNLSAWTGGIIMGGYYPDMSLYGLKGDIAGVILCPAQDSSTRTLIRQYLAAKVGVTL